MSDQKNLHVTFEFERNDKALHFTFADTSVDITATDDKTGEKRDVGKIEAMLGGGIKFVYNDPESGDREQYIATARTLWNSFCEAREIPTEKIEKS